MFQRMKRCTRQKTKTATASSCTDFFLFFLKLLLYNYYMDKVFIIGAGFSGLASGVFLSKSGFDVEIFEQHFLPGGLSQGWSRKGYRFEGGMHWLTGSSPKIPLNKVWKECGALKENNPIYNRDPIYNFFDGKINIPLYRDMKRTQEELIRISPADKKKIKKIMKHVKYYSSVHLPINDLRGLKTKHKVHSNLRELIKMIPAGLLFPKFKSISNEEYISKIKDERIKHLLRSVVGTSYNAVSFVYTFGGFCSGDYGNPYGGSTVMIENMEQEFKAAGGKINYRSKVEKICVEDRCVKGIMVNGEFKPCDAVIVSQDTMRAVDDLFEPPLEEDWVKKMKDYHPSRSCMFFACGADVDLSHYPENLIIPIDEPFELAGENFTEIRLNNYAGNRYYSKEGTTSLTSVLSGNCYDFWKKAKENGTYDKLKSECMEKILSHLYKFIPELKGHIEVTDYSTPLTYERYCSSWEGSWMSAWYKKKPSFSHPLKSKKIKGLYFEGHRTKMPGGLPITLSSARKASQLVCRDFGHWWLDVMGDGSELTCE